MDPNANREEQLRLASSIIENFDTWEMVDVYDAARLAELVIALDEWIRGGGFLPQEWQR